MASTTGDATVLADMTVTEESLRIFIGPRIHKYLPHWQKLQASGKKSKISWHWPAFFVPVPWMLYRKMYLSAAVFFFLPIILALLLPNLKSANLGLSIMIALWAKDWYLVHARKRIEKIAARYPDPAQRQEKLARAGGVSLAAGIVGGIVMVIQLLLALAPFLAKTWN